MRKKPWYSINCEKCGKTFEVPEYRAFSARYCSTNCCLRDNPPNQKTIKRNYGVKHHRWKGGKTIRKDGYVLVSIKGKRYFEHRYVMEKHLGRKLKRSETVHHVDGDRSNNRLKNLELLTRSEHTMKYHRKGVDF